MSDGYIDLEIDKTCISTRDMRNILVFNKSSAEYCCGRKLTKNERILVDQIVSLRAAASERDELKRTVQAQAEQLEQAREVILKYRSLKLGPRGFCSENLFEHHNLADEWLAANATQDVTA